MKRSLKACLGHKKFHSEDAAWAGVRGSRKRTIGDFRPWKCGGHWHLKLTQRSIWVKFDLIAQEHAS